MLNELIRRYVILLFLVILIAGVGSCRKVPASQITHVKNPLWKVTSDKGTLYLLGTVHLLKHTDYPLSEGINKALMDSDVAVFELDIQESASKRSRELLTTYSTFHDKRTLKDSLSPDTYSNVVAFLNSSGIDLEEAGKLKPWYMANLITVIELQNLGFTSDFGADVQMYTKALAMGKDIEALETLDYQLGLFNSMSMADQEAFLRQTIEELNTLKKDFPEIVKAWKSGDTGGLMKLLETCKDFQETCDRIIDQRNVRWMPRIENLLRTQRHAIVIVGAAHMVGEKGLLNLLRQKGYRVEQL